MSATSQTPAAPASSTAAPVIEPVVVAPVEPAVTTPEIAKETVVAPTPPPVPEKYELKLPEGVKLDGKLIEDVASYAKENGLSNEQAQKLLDRQSGAVIAHNQTLLNEYQAQIKTWQDVAMADKEIGGDNLKASQELAFRAVDKYGGEAFRKILVDTGYEHHPEVLRAFSRIGKAMAEDRMHNPASQPGPTQVSHSAKLYDHPTSNKK